MYIQERKILGVFVSDVRASGFWASGGLEPSKNAFGRGPRLGLDTPLKFISIRSYQATVIHTFLVVIGHHRNKRRI